MQPGRFDVLVRGGTVIDGYGRARYRADIGVTGDRILDIGALIGARARVEVDATGRYVVPGFIDAHVHGDATVRDPALQLAALRQGVTTLVLGQDGLSFAPATPDALAWVSRYFSAVNGCWTIPPVVVGGHGSRRLPAGLSVADLLTSYHRTTALNTVYLLPHGTVRYCVLGSSSKAPDVGELAAMVRLAEQGIEQGAAGVSSGLGYLPGRYANPDELAAVCRPAARRGLPYVTHMRAYGEFAATGMAEACAIGRQAQVPVHISHYHGPGVRLAELVDTALADGLDLTYDTYPYLRGCSILAKILPDWLGTPELDRTLDLLTDCAVRRRFAEQTNPALWQQLTLAHVPSPAYQWAVGMRLNEAARRAGTAPADFCAELLVDTALGAGVIFDFPETEDSIRTLLHHDSHMGGSDGIYLGGLPHPRGYGTFARLLARHVRELGDWTWEQAVVHLAARPAERFALTDRGTIACGHVADIAIINPTTINDHATYSRPHALATGVDDVLIAGVPVLSGGQLTGKLAGTALRPR